MLLHCAPRKRRKRVKLDARRVNLEMKSKNVLGFLPTCLSPKWTDQIFNGTFSCIGKIRKRM